MAKGASEDRLTPFVDVLEADTGVPRDCWQAAMDGCGKRAMGRGGGGSTKSDLIVVVVVVVVVLCFMSTRSTQYMSRIT